MTAGWNYVVLCGTSAVDATPTMSNTFGGKLVSIDDVEGFCALAAELLGAKSTMTRDVIYRDSKVCTASRPDIVDIVTLTGLGNLTPGSLRAVNMALFEDLYEIGRLPTLFLKPACYAHEKERRIAFELPQDVEGDFRDINDSRLSKFVKVIA